MAPPDASLVEVLDALGEGATVRLEHRHPRYMFGCLNYGEVPGYRNAADGDAWDIFAPGYEGMLPHAAYACGGVIGILALANGNHKIAVRLAHPGYDERRAKAEIRRYARTYTQRMKLHGHWLWYGRSAHQNGERRPPTPRRG